jgi:hypothetical protein
MRLWIHFLSLVWRDLAFLAGYIRRHGFGCFAREITRKGAKLDAVRSGLASLSYVEGCI